MFVLSEARWSITVGCFAAAVPVVKLLAQQASVLHVKFDRRIIIGKMLQLIKMKILSTLTADPQTTRFGLNVEGIAAAINEPDDDACDDAVAGGLRAILAQLIGEGWINQVYDLGHSTSDGTLFYIINPSKNPGSEYANVESVEEMSSSIVTSDDHCSICWETELDMEWTDEEKTRVSLSEKFCANRVLQMFLLENHFGTGCNHCFHSGCIYRWIDTQKKNNLQPDCPICRRAIGPQKLLEFQKWKARATAKAEAKERRKKCVLYQVWAIEICLMLFCIYTIKAIEENDFNLDLGLITRAGDGFVSVWNGNPPLYTAQAMPAPKLLTGFLLAPIFSNLNLVDVNQPSTQGKTPLYNAIEKNHSFIVNLLLTRNQVQFQSIDPSIIPGSSIIPYYKIGRAHV
jgi:hypothetical protein